MASEEDLQKAREVVRAVDTHFDVSERLRLGKWIDPDERERTIAQHIATALTAARAETWKKARILACSRIGVMTNGNESWLTAERVELLCDDIRELFEAAAGSKTKVFSREDEQKNLGR